ncbi:glycosyltransferase [Salibacter halophilus]|nr:glycosyltransferase [Salibacter halophilus]
MVLPFLYLLVTLLYSSNVDQGIKSYERYSIILIIPWVFYANRSYFNGATLKKVFAFFAVVISILVVYAVSTMIFAGTFHEMLNSKAGYYIVRTKFESVTGLHPTYFSIYAGIAIVGLVHFVINTTKRKYHFPVFVLLSILTVGLLVASSKMLIFSTVLSVIFVVRKYLKQRKYLIISGFSILIIAVLLISLKPTRQRLTEFYSAITTKSVDHNNPDGMRKIIYSSSVDAVINNFWVGSGLGDEQNELNKIYSIKGYDFAVEKEYNTHNQYLHFTLVGGIIGLFLFVLLLLTHLVIAKISNNDLYKAVLIIFTLSFCTENILNRQDGIFVFAFFTALLPYASWKSIEGQVFVNGKFLKQKLTGVQRFAGEIINQFDKNKIQHKIIRPNQKNAIWLILWEQVLLPFYLLVCGRPVLVNLCNIAPVVYPANIVIIHDLAFLENKNWYSKPFQLWYNYAIPRVALKALRIGSVSNFTKNELLGHFDIPSYKVKVLYNGIPTFKSSLDIDEPIVKGNYALSVGSINKRKNQETLIRAFLENKDLPVKLVLAGSIDEKLFGDSDLTEKINTAENIEFIESPGDSELINLYKNADLTFYIPFYEGFGLPVLESFYFKKPTVVSNIEVFNELYSDFAVFADPNDVTDIADKCRETFNNRHSIIETMNDQEGSITNRFSYKKTALELYKLIKPLTF